MISGEALPIVKGTGDTIIGGTLNMNGALHIRVTHVGSEAALARIVNLVETAQMAKAPIQKFADYVSKKLFSSSTQEIDFLINPLLPLYAPFMQKLSFLEGSTFSML